MHLVDSLEREMGCFMKIDLIPFRKLNGIVQYLSSFDVKKQLQRIQIFLQIYQDLYFIFFYLTLFDGAQHVLNAEEQTFTSFKKIEHVKTKNICRANKQNIHISKAILGICSTLMPSIHKKRSRMLKRDLKKKSSRISSVKNTYKKQVLKIEEQNIKRDYDQIPQLEQRPRQ